LQSYWFEIITKDPKGAVLFKQQNLKLVLLLLADHNEKKQHLRTSTELGVL